MEEMIIMTEISMPNDEDWNYYLQNTPDNYLRGVLVSLLEENRFFCGLSVSQTFVVVCKRGRKILHHRIDYQKRFILII